MNWEALGAIGEIVGAVAVVLTLGYLAVQIRQNNRSLHQAALQETARCANDFSSLLVRDPDLNRIYSKGISDYSSLSGEELSQFSHLLYIGLRNYWVAEHPAGEGPLFRNICGAYEAAFRVIFASPKMLDWLAESEPYLGGDLREKIRELVVAQQDAEADRP